MKLFIVLLFLVAIAEYTQGAFMCYKCDNCGTNWDPSRAYMVFTAGGSNHCTRRVSGNVVIRDYSPVCPGNGVLCCQGDLCNSSNSKYYINIGLLLSLSLAGFIARYI